MLLLLMRTRLLLLLRRAVVRVMVLSKRIARYHLYENKASFITEYGCCDQLARQPHHFHSPNRPGVSAHSASAQNYQLYQRRYQH